jgi:hypothetical protein
MVRLKIYLGDTNANGQIDGAEVARCTAPYILWSAGPDTLLGPGQESLGPQNGTAPAPPPPAASITTSDVQRCDDIPTFNQ